MRKVSGPAFDRLYKNMFICLKCNAKIRSDSLRVTNRLVKCRKCGSYKLRLKAKEPRGAAKQAA